MSVLGASIASAQTIKGSILDAHSGEPLVGAYVSLKGTDMRTMVKLDGTFLFKNIKAGNYELAVDYVGYKLPKVEKLQ